MAAHDARELAAGVGRTRDLRRIVHRSTDALFYRASVAAVGVPGIAYWLRLPGIVDLRISPAALASVRQSASTPPDGITPDACAVIGGPPGTTPSRVLVEIQTRPIAPPP